MREREGIEYKEGEAIASGLSKGSVEKFADDVREALKVRAGQPLEEQVRRLGGEIFYEDPLSWRENDGTIYVHGPREFELFLSSLTTTRRDRFTIAHELGHYFLHSQQGKIPIIANRHGSNRVEWEANWFAAAFLMPKTEFRKLFNQGYSPLRLAAHFGVSEAAASIRSKSLNLGG